jgi:hypothetical protein
MAVVCLTDQRGIALILIVSLAALAQYTSPAQAHFTMGLTPSSSRWHDQDFDPHTPGPLGYVWPGAGMAAYQGFPNSNPPGYQPPLPGGNPPGAPASWYQLEGNSYSPFGAIPASSEIHQNTGDLIFALNFSQPSFFGSTLPDVVQFTDWYTYVPPEFSGIITSQITTTVTNDYRDLEVFTASASDPFAPNWNVIHLTINKTLVSPNARAGQGIIFSKAHNYAEWYYLRVNGVIAPSIVGRYFFKMIFRFGNETFLRYPADSSPSFMSMPLQNWPILLVTGDFDPAVITGTIRFGSSNMSLYWQGIPLPGRVRALGAITDPVTGEATGRSIEGRGYYNASAGGHYEIEGLPEGKYQLFASSAGYPESPIAEGVTLFRGQSLHLDAFLKPGPVLSGTVFSAHALGEQPWVGLRPISVEIYNSSRYSEEHLLSFSPRNLTSRGPGEWTNLGSFGMSYNWNLKNVASPRAVAFSWSSGLSYYRGGGCGGSFDPCGVANGVGPAQFWWVDPNGTYTNHGGPSAFNFQFGEEGVYGVPTILDGHVPQALATWIDGLKPGRYYVRAFLTGYVQTSTDGSTFLDYYFDVPSSQLSDTDFHIPLILRRSGFLNVTVWFHNRNSTLVSSPIPTDRTLLVELLDSHQNTLSFNFTRVQNGSLSSNVLLDGLGMHGHLAIAKWSAWYYRGFGYQDYGIPAPLAGNYFLRFTMQGYVQLEDMPVSLILGGSETHVSAHMYRGAVLRFTIHSTSWGLPQTSLNWVWDKEPINVSIIDSSGTTVDVFRGGFQNSNMSFAGPFQFEGTDQPADFEIVNEKRPTAFISDTYTISTNTYGYVQENATLVNALDGAVSDFGIILFQGTSIELTVKFFAENMFANAPFNMSARIRVFDDRGRLVGSWTSTRTGAGTGVPTPQGQLSYVPCCVGELSIAIAGLPNNYLDPFFGASEAYGITGYPYYTGSWSVEFDAVNWYLPNSHFPPVPALLNGESYHIIPGESNRPFGLTGYSLKANHLGPFQQRMQWSLPNARLGGGASAIFILDLRGYVAGAVYYLNWDDQQRTTSFATVTFTNAEQRLEVVVYSYDGFYDTYVPAGDYNVTVSAWAAARRAPLVVSNRLHVAEAQSATGTNFYLSAYAVAETDSPVRLTIEGLFIIVIAMLIFRRSLAERNGSLTERIMRNESLD